MCSEDNGRRCRQTLQRLIYSVIGDSPSDCNVIDVVHYGNPRAGLQRGLSDLVISQGGYMLSMLTYAITVESAYQALLTDD